MLAFKNLNDSRIYHDSLEVHFFLSHYWPTANLKSSGYETLKSIGIDQLQSEAIKASIVDLYENTHGELFEMIRVSDDMNKFERSKNSAE